MADLNSARAPSGATGVLVLASGEIVWGKGFGAEGAAVGEVCFNTSITGYQEIMTDPSYAGQIINFTFPHIGNVGTNPEDIEANNPHALGAIVREDVTDPSNFRSTQHFDAWMKGNGRIGLSGIDTRALTRMIRVAGAPNAVIAHNAAGEFDLPALLAQAQGWPGLEGMDLAKDVTTLQSYGWDDGLWTLKDGYKKPSPLQGRGLGEGAVSGSSQSVDSPHPNPSPEEEGHKRPHVVAIDYGIKRNILRNLIDAGARVTVVPATATLGDVMAHNPDGLFLSNGHQGLAGNQKAAVWHLPWSSDARPRHWGENQQDAPRPSRREPPGQAAKRRRGGNHQHEPRLRGRNRHAARKREGDSCVAVRWIAVRVGTDRSTGIFGAVPPRGVSWAAG
jgi:carbamoyl-phosphate synthase small subunit